jgi:lipopolysaccharide/colanic/teichoic acid biosynthesis glycosyltransferase
MIRFFDILISIIVIILLLFLLLFLFLLILIIDGNPLFKQQRLGINKNVFFIYKFRTMKLATPNISTHLLNQSSVTYIGRILRKTKLDELPQLWNVLVGEMSLVGPRPNLVNQFELIYEREKKGIYSVRPGITGLAQISNIDMSNPQLLATFDAKMIEELNIRLYFKYIFLTIFGKGFGDRIK